MQRTSFWERALLREQNDDERQEVINAVAKEDPAFLLILGDLVSVGGSKKAWKIFDSVTSPLRKSAIPMVAIVGNHEYFGERKNGLKHFLSRFRFPEERTWMSICFKGLAFILLNSNLNKMTLAETESQDTQGITKRFDDLHDRRRLPRSSFHQQHYRSGKQRCPGAFRS
jgi:predicted MPP superfamily phosphohydrolase